MCDDYSLLNIPQGRQLETMGNISSLLVDLVLGGQGLQAGSSTVGQDSERGEAQFFLSFSRDLGMFFFFLKHLTAKSPPPSPGPAAHLPNKLQFSRPVLLSGEALGDEKTQTELKVIPCFFTSF